MQNYLQVKKSTKNDGTFFYYLQTAETSRVQCLAGHTIRDHFNSKLSKQDQHIRQKLQSVFTSLCWWLSSIQHLCISCMLVRGLWRCIDCTVARMKQNTLQLHPDN